jgi:MFS family permease
MLLAPMLPSRGRRVASGESSWLLLKPATLVALTAMGAFYVNVGAYWTYIELIGQARGLTSRVATNCIAVGISAGALGGALAWSLGDRFGRALPLLVGTLLTVGAALLLNGSVGVVAFVVSGLLYFSAWNYSLAYQLAIVNEVDPTGRSVALAGVSGFIGVGTGAALAGLTVTPADYRAIYWLVSVSACVSTVLFVFASSLHKNAAVSIPGSE